MSIYWTKRHGTHGHRGGMCDATVLFSKSDSIIFARRMENHLIIGVLSPTGSILQPQAVNSSAYTYM
jgi:hypothetical protein